MANLSALLGLGGGAILPEPIITSANCLAGSVYINTAYVSIYSRSGSGRIDKLDIIKGTYGYPPRYKVRITVDGNAGYTLINSINTNIEKFSFLIDETYGQSINIEVAAAGSGTLFYYDYRLYLREY